MVKLRHKDLANMDAGLNKRSSTYAEGDIDIYNAVDAKSLAKLVVNLGLSE